MDRQTMDLFTGRKIYGIPEDLHVVGQVLVDAIGLYTNLKYDDETDDGFYYLIMDEERTLAKMNEGKVDAKLE